MNIKFFHVIFSLIFLLLTGCAHNNIYRGGGVEKCKKNRCEQALIEQHNDENYDLAFVEFTERGNLFDRSKLDDVVNYIEDQKNKNDGVMVLVYVHGWKHNASNSPGGDVNEFRKLLSEISENKLENKKVIGVYIGWRGLTYHNEPFKTLLTFWGRKRVAHQVGSGGVSEVLLRLEKVTKNVSNPTKNTFVVAGHSFGAAVILASMKNILIDRIINTEQIDYGKCYFRKEFKNICSSGCYKTKPFGDGVILLNPAVEANELMQIKSLTTEEQCYAEEQPKLLHILTTNSDKATRYAFGVGQFLGVSIREKEEILKRFVYKDDTDKKRKIELNEMDLDLITIGHYPPFRTGSSKKCTDDSGVKKECYVSCKGDASCIENEAHKRFNFPVSPYEPISVVYTDSSVMRNHTDIFNGKVVAYIATAIMENKFKKDSGKVIDNFKMCVKEHKNSNFSFNFNSCLAFYRNRYEKYE